MTDTNIKITASFTFCGREFSDVECINPGDWFGKTWLLMIGDGMSFAQFVVEADSATDAIDELIDSGRGDALLIDECAYGDYGIGTDNPTCYFGGNSGRPCDLEWLSIHAFSDLVDNPNVLYHVDGWLVPIKPTELRDVQDKMEQRDEYRAQVSGPGKFEGEAPYVPYFWDAYLNGAADDDTDGILTFHVTDEDRALFPELADRDAVYLYEDSNGFVGEADGPAEDVDDMSGRFDSDDRPTFSVIEYSSFYAVRHNPTGEERPMGDGVDTLFDDNCEPLTPGTEEFRKAWEDSLNGSECETLEAYFPHLVDED